METIKTHTKFFIRSVSNNGGKSKQYFEVISSDKCKSSLVIRRLLLVKESESEVTGGLMLKRFKGYCLHETIFGIKMSTLELVIGELIDKRMFDLKE